MGTTDPFDGSTPGWRIAALEEFEPQVVELAEEVLGQCRVALMMSYRFLDAALWRMPFEAAHILRTLETDGKTLWFNPILVLHRFRKDSNELVRDMLHAIVHCILRHPYDDTHDNTRAWWLACDMATEAMAMEMAGDAFPSDHDDMRRKAIADFRGITDVLTPERIYQAIINAEYWMNAEDTSGIMSKATLQALENLFVRDSHGHWPQPTEEGNNRGENGKPEKEKSSNLGDAESAPNDAQAGGEQNPNENLEGDKPRPEDESDEAERPEEDAGERDEDPDTQPAEESDSEDAHDAIDPQPTLDERNPDESEQDWEEISKRIQEELETFSHEHGKAAGTLLANVTVSNRKPVDYADFLHRFATMREDMKVNDDEFDYIFYTYGLELYGNMPLVEPLEYQETNRVRDFVIAIDTSGSCSGELVRRFIDRTFQILCESQEFGSKVNIHIVQCDDVIQEDTKISSLDEMRRFRDEYEVKGMGGTDFRPVFDYVDELVAKGEFNQLGGVIYFTDGYGIFPKRPPDYPTAFVFLEDKGNPRAVPPWAMKVVLRDDQLRLI